MRVRQCDGHLQSGEHLPSIARGTVDEMRDRLRCRCSPLRLQSARDQYLDVGFGERVETEQSAATAQRWIDLEERVLRRGADQCDRSILDRGQQRVLLRLGEAVDLIKEKNRALAMLTESLTGALDHFPHILDTRAHRAHLLECALRAARDRKRERRLACPGRSPEDRAGQSILLH